MKTCVSKMLVSFLLLAACDSTAGGPEVVVQTAEGPMTVHVEVADTRSARSFGLMYRRELAPDAGMFFIFDDLAVRSFWMKNTVLPLDMIFIDDALEIVGILRDTIPFTTTSHSVDVPSRYVLEVNAGFSAKHGVQPGTRIEVRGISGVAPVPGG